MYTIAIVDDDINIGNMLTELLESEGYGTLRAYSGTELLMMLKSETPDLILLDLNLPGLSGEEVLPLINGIPVIVVSAKAEISGKVELLLGGASDYVTKPFDNRELLARIKVQLRGNVSPDSSVINAGGLSLCCDTLTVKSEGVEIRLTRTECAILKLLMLNPDRPLGRTAILEKISLDTPDCTERSLKQHISNLRKKLSAVSGKDYIESVYGIGFKLRS